MDFINRIHVGNALTILKQMPDEFVNCCVTSPPYWGLRDYGIDGQLGLEKTPEEYVAKMVEVFREVRRVLRKDGTLWLNLGDSYSSPAGGQNNFQSSTLTGGRGARDPSHIPSKKDSGLKPKDLVGIPWRVAFALQADGWWLRSDIIWAKPNPMPESVTDRPTKAHEYIFLLTKSAKYFWNQEAVREPHMDSSLRRYEYGGSGANGKPFAMQQSPRGNESGRNIRTVWTIATQSYKEAHFATFPEEIPERCIKAGCPEGGVVLDPFIGSGTVAKVAIRLRRQYIGIDINPKYYELAQKRKSWTQVELM